jgi:hypothetical protein
MHTPLLSRTQLSTLLAVSLLAATPLVAQTSTASTVITHDGVGCQYGNGWLTNYVTPGAGITFAYDQSTGVLSVTIDNTTPVVAGEATATISEVHFNLPPGAVTGAVLANQTGAGGATPAFTLSFDADTAAAPNPNGAGCLGNFNVTLSGGAIANAAATNVATANPTIGPVTFSIQLTGPGTDGIDAEAAIATISQNATIATNVAATFQDGGVTGTDAGISGACDFCRTAMYTTGSRTPGGQFDICVSGGYGCHACVWVSATAGPTTVGNETIPIGLPIAAAWTLGNFGLAGAGNSFCIPVNVPNNPQLSGFTFHVVNITYNALNVVDYSFSAPLEIVIN